MKIGNINLLKLIGKGTMGEIYLSKKDNSKEYFATKKIDKKSADRPAVRKYFINEISILKKLKHNKIVRLIELKQTPSHYYIVMEYCNGGSLLSCLRKYITMYKTPFSEDIVQYLMRQIVRGLKYIHDNGIIHRDIKLDNILVKFYSEEDLKRLKMMKTHVKISDFGISIKPGENKMAYTAIGSPAYMDPFILKKLNERNDLLNSQGYDQSSDIWSLGAMCYEMLIGKRVFTGRSLKELYKKVEGGNYSLPTHLSKEAVSFLNGMLQYDPEKRLNIEEISRHHFLTKNTREFSSIDFALVASKLGEEKIYINTKNNNTLWKIFNEETEGKLSQIPTRILDLNTYADTQPQENEIDYNNNKNENNKHENDKNENITFQPQITEFYQPSQQYNHFVMNAKSKDISSKFNSNFITTNTNSTNINNTNINTPNINSNTNYNTNFAQSQMNINTNYNINYAQSQMNNKDKSNYIPKKFKDDKIIQNYDVFNGGNNNIQTNNNYQNNNINYLKNASMNYDMNYKAKTNINDTYTPYPKGTSNPQNTNIPFYAGHTTIPQANNNFNQQMYRNYPGDIKVTKEIATTNESCIPQ